MKRYTYEDFLGIIETLRSENGCPWDREQTHESLRPCLMEEAAEVLAAIRIYEKTGSAENLQEELGDVLLQVVMHAQIAKEEGLFAMEDVVNDVATKMVRRHPHVFGDVSADTSAEVLKNWDEIKQKEKEGKAAAVSPFAEIPLELPALTRASKIIKKADKLYGRHVDMADNIKRIEEAAAGMRDLPEEGAEAALIQKAGDILMALSDIARQRKLSLEQILSDRAEDLADTCEATQKNR